MIKNQADLGVQDAIGWTPEVYATYIGNLALADTLKTETLHSPDLTIVKPINTVDPRQNSVHPATPAQIRNIQIGLCNVQFRVRARVAAGQYVAILGNRKILGSWDFTKAFPMSKDSEDESGHESWIAEVQLPAGIETEYRYIVCDGTQVVKYEVGSVVVIVNHLSRLFLAIENFIQKALLMKETMELLELLEGRQPLKNSSSKAGSFRNHRSA